MPQNGPMSQLEEHYVSQPFWQIEGALWRDGEVEGGCRCGERCLCSQIHPFFPRGRSEKSLCSSRTENKEKNFVSLETLQRNLYTMRNRGCFVSLTQVVSEEVISSSSGSLGKENVTSQKSSQKEWK